MNWELILNIFGVTVAYLLMDRCSFWCMSNTYTQFTGKPIDIKYREIAFPRLLLALLGCILLVATRSPEPNVGNVAGLVAMVLSLGMMCWIVIRKYRRETS